MLLSEFIVISEYIWPFNDRLKFPQNMNPPDQLAQLIGLGLYKSVNILSSFIEHPNARVLIQRARAYAELKNYNAAIKTLDSIERITRSEEEINEILELRLTCYLNMNNSAAKCASLLPHLVNRILTPKLHILVARAYIIQDSSHSPNHPAVHHLMEVLKIYPLAIELVEDLLFVGAPIKDILSHIPQSCAKIYMQSLHHTYHSEFKQAIECFSENIINIIPTPTCVLNRICINAMLSGEMTLFDSTAAQLPLDDLEIIDLRASRLKQLKKTDELTNLVQIALNTDEFHANSWLAFSHLLEMNGDHQKALQATRKELLIDRFSRRGFMRHGDLRVQRNDTRKALTAYTKAHQLHEGVDSFSAIVQCCCMLEDWKTAEAFAAKALLAYPASSEHGADSIIMMGLAMRSRDPATAINLLKTALEKSPSNNTALNALIGIKVKEDDLEAAERFLREYREQNRDFYYYLKLGEIYSLKRDYQKALEFVATAARFDPTNERAKDMLEQLESLIRDNDSSDGFDDGEEDMPFFA
ncbi:TPR Domain containing protein [Tritrichomonas foetus]|uniref:TPR Domain containing protein n=1 Tax=Tritrichomonas foetus TaxID=1144522 RepID=A0A1J4KGY3_9EUKA|nr:TPR Domain containing protein [Tritrichomonas foetus]|eukprot:OHT08902.1 TPR Domain containing protein [Tritrichomonas foetus]